MTGDVTATVTEGVAEHSPGVSVTTPGMGPVCRDRDVRLGLAGLTPAPRLSGRVRLPDGTVLTATATPATLARPGG